MINSVDPGNVQGEFVVVTGAASGIGRQVAQAFAERGLRVALLDLDGDGANRAAAELPGEHIGLPVDVAQPESVDSAIAEVAGAFGRIDVLVHCAGISALDPAEEVSREDWSRQIDVNLSGTFFVNQAVGRVMLHQGSGKIVNMASQAGSVALDQHAAYCASKWGVIGLTKVLALEWAPRGITVNTISPTIVMTELGKTAWAGERGEQAKARIPAGRFAEPEEIAAAAIFLASSASDMINGADLVIDGGYTIQ